MSDEGIRIEVGTDIGFLGLWDAARDEEPRKRAWDSDDFDADVRAGHVLQILTDGDGSFDAAIFIDQDVPEDVIADTLPVGDWRLLAAPSGRLCLGGLEDFRSRKKQITREESHFDVEPGDYRVLCRAIDVRIPELDLAKALGAEDYRYWKQQTSKMMRGCSLLALVGIAGIITGALYNWWIAGGTVAVVTLVALLRPADSKYTDIDDRVTEICGGRDFDDVLEEFITERPSVVLELRHLTADEPRPDGGLVALREVWDLPIDPDTVS